MFIAVGMDTSIWRFDNLKKGCSFLLIKQRYKHLQPEKKIPGLPTAKKTWGGVDIFAPWVNAFISHLRIREN